MPCLVVLTKMDDEHARPDEVVADIKPHLKTPIAVMEVPDGVGTELPRRHRGPHRQGLGRQARGAELDARRIAIPPESKPPRRRGARAPGRRRGRDRRRADREVPERGRPLAGGARRGRAPRGRATASSSPSTRRPARCPAASSRCSTAIVDLAAVARPAGTPFAGRRHRRGARRRGRTAPLAALVFKTHIDPHAGKVSYVRVLSGTLKPDASLAVAGTGTASASARSRRGRGRSSKPIAEAVAGRHRARSRSSSRAKTGDTLSDEKKPFVGEAAADAARALRADAHRRGQGASEEKAAQALQRICEEDPGLVFKHDAAEPRDAASRGWARCTWTSRWSGCGGARRSTAASGPRASPTARPCAVGRPASRASRRSRPAGTGSSASATSTSSRCRAASGFVFEDAIVGGVIPRQFIPSVEKGIARRWSAGCSPGYPGGGRQGAPGRRQVPRRRLVGRRVPGGGRARPPRGDAARAARAARAHREARGARCRATTWATSSATSTRAAAA